MTTYWRIRADEPRDRFNNNGPFVTGRFATRAQALKWLANELSKPAHPWRATAALYLTNSAGLRERVET
jgi:hypothetical protein